MNKACTSSSLSDCIALCKLNISLPVTLTTFTGFVLFTGQLSITVIYVCAGVLLLASSASAINHILERKTDALMERTAKRPVASGRIKIYRASFGALVLAVAGALLLIKTGLIPFFLGLFNMFWYTIIYTGLKRITAFAVIPGSLVGAIPPVIGWTAAGGYPLDGHILLVALFFFIGQIPHFWLLIMRYGRDYEKAGLPSITGIFSERQIHHITLTWIAASAMAALMLVVFGLLNSITLSVLLIIATIVFLVSFAVWLNVDRLKNIRKHFMIINFYYLLVTVALIINSFIYS